MKPFIRSMGIAGIAVGLAAAAIVFSARPKPPPDPILRSLRQGGAWSKEFKKRYPVPLSKMSKPPLLGRTGDMGNTTAFEFFLNDFPKEYLPALESWLRDRMKADAISKVTLHGLFPDEKWPKENFVRSETIVLHGDGRREELQGMEASPLSFNGRPIPYKPNP